MSQTSSASLSALLAAHERDREARAGVLARRCADAITFADEVESNARAVLGLELNSCIAIEQALKVALQQLRVQVASLTRECTAHGRAYGALVKSTHELASPRDFLASVHAALARSNANMATVTERLTREV